MSIIVQRSCASSNRVDDEKIVFSSFTINFTRDQRNTFEDIHRYLHEEDRMTDAEKFDRVRMARTLEEIIDTGIHHLGQLVYDEFTPQRMVNE